MGEGDEADFDGYFIEASEHEPSEPLVLFYVSEYRFDLVSLPSFFYSLLACQQLFYLISVADQIRVPLDGAIACRLMAGASHRTAPAVLHPVHSRVFRMAADARSLGIADISHRLAGRTGVGVVCRVVIKIIRVKCVCLMFPVGLLFVE